MSVPAGRVRAVRETAAILGRLCFVDIETTGLDPTSDQIIEIGAVFVERGVVTGRRRWMVRPSQPIPPLITALTGLQDEDVRDAAPFEALTGELREVFGGWTLVAHNASFERSFLREVVATNAMLDSFELSQLLFPQLASHSLDALVRWLEVGRGARHRAVDDAEDTFQVLAAMADLIIGADRSFLDALLFHLEPAQSADRAALCAVLRALKEAPFAPAEPRSGVALTDRDHDLSLQLIGWLNAPLFVSAELERSALLATAFDAAQRTAEPIAVAVPGADFREWSQTLPAIPRRAVCATQLDAALRTRGDSEPEQLGKAWLSSWLYRTRSGDLESVSRFIRARSEAIRELVERISRCTCTEASCFARRELRETPAVLISHELALDWLERGAPAKLIVLDADRLPETERRRTQRTLSFDDLDALGLDTTEVREASALLTPGVVPLRARLQGPWLRLREALHAVSHRLKEAPLDEERARLLQRIVDVLAPPPPGFETQIAADTLGRVPVRIGERLTRRLHGGHVLVSSWRGGLGWTRTSTIALPADGVEGQLEWIEAAVPLPELVSLVRNEPGSTLVVAPGPLVPLADAFVQSGLSVSLDEEREARVQLREWSRGKRMPPVDRCVLYGIREWRRAVLAIPARQMILASPQGLPATPMRRALVGLDARPVPLRT